MNEVIPSEKQLPGTLPELSKFVLVGREKLTVVRAEIRAIKKVGLAKEVHEQKLAEAQAIAEAVLDAEVQIGRLTSQMPKASGTRTDIEPVDNGVRRFEKPKKQSLEEIGLSERQANRFETLAKHPEVVQKAKEDARRKNDIVNRSNVLKAIKKEKASAKADAKKYQTPTELPSSFLVFKADIKSGIPEIGDETVDFIITDPPYPKEYIPLYSDLSALAERVLKPNGSLLVMCGQSYLPEVLKRLTEKMTYHWTLCYLTPGGQSPSLWAKNTNTFWKPIIWLTKEGYKGDYVGDVIKTEVNTNDKRFHQWGQSENGFASIIERFTYPNDVIFDPFLGGGTTGICAALMNRKFIGTDISEECISITKERVMERLAECKEREN